MQILLLDNIDFTFMRIHVLYLYFTFIKNVNYICNKLYLYSNYLRIK